MVDVEVRIDTQIFPKSGNFKYVGSIIQGDGGIDDDVTHCVREGWMDGGLHPVSCEIRMCYQDLKVSFYKVVI